MAQASGTWYSIKTKQAEALKQDTAAGSSTNKWVLTQIVFSYTKVSSSTSLTTISLATNHGSKPAFTFTPATNSTSLANLNNNAATQTVNFDYSDDIQTFTITATQILWLSSLSLTYTIDYGSC